jgi:hypothetical protein
VRELPAIQIASLVLTGPNAVERATAVATSADDV